MDIDYKEKLRLAKEALESGSYDKDTIEYIFPELMESEDEMIRKSLIDMLKNDEKCYLKEIAWLEKQGEQKPVAKNIVETWKDMRLEVYQQASGNRHEHNYSDDSTKMFSLNDIDEIIEKMSEQKLGMKKDFAPKVEHLIPQKGMYYTCIKDYYSSDNTHLYVKGNVYKSPFNGYIEYEAHLGLSWTNSCAEKYFEQTKNDDWIVCEHNNVIGKPMQYKEFKKKEMQRFIENLKAQGLTPKLRLWNIQDAENGDVLAFYAEYKGNKMVQVGIIEKYVGKHGGCSNTFKIYIGVNWENNLQIGNHMGCSDIRPATKEQRDLLFAKMKEAGYEWDAEKLELRKVEQKIEEKPLISLTDFQKAFELKAKQYDINLPHRGYDIHAMCKELYSLLTKQKPAE